MKKLLVVLPVSLLMLSAPAFGQDAGGSSPTGPANGASADHSSGASGGAGGMSSGGGMKKMKSHKKKKHHHHM